MKFFVAFLACIAVVSAESIDAFIESDGNTVWSADTVLLWSSSTLIVKADDTLTIEEGTLIITKMEDGDDPLTIEGVMKIEGTTSNPVIFEFSPSSPVDGGDDTLPVSILLTGSAKAFLTGTIMRSQRPIFADDAVIMLTDSSLMEVRDCEFVNSTELFHLADYSSVTIRKSSFTGSTNSDGLIRFEGKSITMTVDSSVFSDNSNFSDGSIFTLNGISTVLHLTLTNSDFKRNKGGGGGVLYLPDAEGTLDISDCRFIGNRVTGTAGILYATGGPLSISIVNSAFESDSALDATKQFGNCGAFMISLRYSGRVTIANSSFTKNRAGHGTGCGYILAEAVSIIQTVFYDNTAIKQNNPAGGALKIDFPCALLIANSTFANNGASIGGGLYLCDVASGNNRVVNTIFAGNTAQFGSQILLENTNNTVFSNCYVSSGIDNIYYYNTYSKTQNLKNIIYSGELFNDSAKGDLSLAANSPCVNGGMKDTSGLKLPAKDLTGTVNRVVGDTIDIGAYEYPFINAIRHDRFHPLTSAISSNAPAVLTVCTVRGQAVYHNPGITAPNGSINTLIPQSLSAGIYLVMLKKTDGTRIVQTVARY